MNTDQQVLAATGHLVDAAPTPPTWENGQVPAVSPAAGRWPALVLAAAIVWLAVAMASGATRTDSPRRVEASAATHAPSTTIPMMVTAVAPAPTNTLAVGPPQAIVVGRSRTLTLPAAGYCWMTAEDSQTGTGRGRCSAGPGDGQSLRVAAGERLAVSFSTTEDPRDLTASVITGVEATEQRFLAVSGTIPAEILIALQPGSYKLNIDGRWSQGSASYTIKIEVIASVNGPTSPSEAPPITTCIYRSATMYTLGNGRVLTVSP